MSTLRVSNIEAKADASSPTINEKLKVTNSNGDVQLTINGETAGIATVSVNGKVGINTDIPAEYLNIFSLPESGDDAAIQLQTTTLDVNKARISKENTGELIIRSSLGSSGRAIVFETKGSGQTERMRIKASGEVGIGTGLTSEILTVAGNVRVENSADAAQYLNITYQGINFQNTGAGSSTTSSAHLLDDYEEGTFTPTIANGLTNPSLTSVFGYYVKVGTLVMCSIDFRMDGTQTGNSGSLAVGNLPFSSSSESSIYGSATISFNNILTGFTELRAGHFNNTSLIRFYDGSSSIAGNTAGVNFSNQRRLIMQVIYKST
jgi:hypothetical protein